MSDVQYDGNKPFRGRRRLGTIQPVLDDIGLAETEMERRELFKKHLAQRDVDESESSPTTSCIKLSRQSTSSSGMSQEQIASSLSEAVKLISSNKYGVKNAFDCTIIDLIPNVVKDAHPNFQNVGSALDAGAKIYAYRVDNIYQEANKVLGTLSKKKPQRDRLEDDEDDERNDENEDEGAEEAGPSKAAKAAAAKKKRQRNLKGRTVEENESALNLPAILTDYEDDSLFRKVCSHFNEGGLNGLLLNNVFSSNDSAALRLHSLSAPNAYAKAPHPDQDKVKPECSLMSREDFKYPCPSIRTFTFSDWDQKKNASSQEILLNLTGASPEKPNEFRAETADDDMDFGVEDVGDSDPTNLAHSSSPSVVQPPTDEMDVADLLAKQDQEYSYFDQSKIDLLKGPSHWKIGETKAEKKSKLLKKPKPTKKIDLSVRIPEPEVLPERSGERRSAFLTAAYLLENREEQLLKAESATTSYDHNQLRSLTTKPNTQVRDARQRPPSPADDANVSAYDYGNSNDTQNFVPEATEPTSDQGYDVTEFFGPGAEGPSGDGEGCSDTVATAAADIVYAKRAKRVDYKKLKSAIWTVLSSDETPVEAESPKKKSRRESEKMEKAISFSDLCRVLPDHLSKSLNQNLSVPITFVGFLHLCNEKVLKLEGNEDFSDFTIQQG